MAVVVQQRFTGATLDQYDEAAGKLGITPEGPHTKPGLLFHYVVATDDGVEITDIWTTREGFETFAQEEIAPVSQEVGISPPTSVEFMEVPQLQHRRVTPDGVRRLIATQAHRTRSFHGRHCLSEPA